MPTMTGTSAFGCGAAFVGRAERPSPPCPIGWRRRRPSACTAGSRPVSTLPPVILPSKPHRTVKTRRTCPIHPPCADGHNGDGSACGAGSRPESETRTFCGHPPSSPGIRKLVGEETINGYLCDKYAFTYHDKSMGTQYQWISKKLKVMIKIARARRSRCRANTRISKRNPSPILCSSCQRDTRRSRYPGSRSEMSA
jgi:hypothetical protein